MMDWLKRMAKALKGAVETGAEAYGSASSPMAPQHAEIMANLLADMTPGVGDIKSGVEGVQAAREGDWLGAGLGAAGALPFIPGVGGMIKTARGKIPETRSDVNTLSDRFQRLLDDAGVKHSSDKSNLSPARYFEFENPATRNQDIGPDLYKVRISDHRNIHGADFSVDPASGRTFEEMVSEVQSLGVPIKNRVKPVKNKQIDDASLEKIWGGPLTEAPQAWVEDKRKNLIWSNKGYWTEKK